MVPLFVLGFLGAIVLRSTGVLPAAAVDVAKPVTTALLAAALFGLGSSVRMRVLIATGPRALALGAASTLLLAGTAYLGILLV